MTNWGREHSRYPWRCSYQILIYLFCTYLEITKILNQEHWHFSYSEAPEAGLIHRIRVGQKAAKIWLCLKSVFPQYMTPGWSALVSRRRGVQVYSLSHTSSLLGSRRSSLWHVLYFLNIFYINLNSYVCQQSLSFCHSNDTGVIIGINKKNNLWCGLSVSGVAYQ